MTSYRALQQQMVRALSEPQAVTERGVSILPMRSDYVGDLARCLAAVAFLPARLAASLMEALIEPLRAIEPDQHYYTHASLHVTIKNVRTVHDPQQFTPEDVIRADQVFRAVVPQHQRWTFSLQELIVLPTSVALIGYCDEGLRDLVQHLDADLRAAGVPDNKQYVSDSIFFGNISLCRFHQPPSARFLDAVAKLRTTYRSELPIETIHLLVCNGVCSPETREVVGTYRLKPV